MQYVINWVKSIQKWTEIIKSVRKKQSKHYDVNAQHYIEEISTMVTT